MPRGKAKPSNWDQRLTSTNLTAYAPFPPFLTSAKEICLTGIPLPPVGINRAK